MGVVPKEIANNASGSVILSGLLRSYELDTSAYSVGTKLFLGSSALTDQKPITAGHLTQQIGVVLKASTVNGEILVIAGGGGGSTEVLSPNNIFLGTGSSTENIHISGAFDLSLIHI